MSLWGAELQRAVYQRLNGNVPRTEVFNAVPPLAEPPFLTVAAETTEIPGAMETQDSDGSEVTFWIRIWDDAHGSLRINRIMAEVDRRLHDLVLDLDGVARAHLRRRSSSLRNEQQDDAAVYWRRADILYRAYIHGVPVAPRST